MSIVFGQFVNSKGTWWDKIISNEKEKKNTSISLKIQKYALSLPGGRKMGEEFAIFPSHANIQAWLCISLLYRI